MTPKQIYRDKAPGVVFVAAQEDGAGSSTCGTGSIVDAKGMVLTNAHVIFDKSDGRPYGAIQVFLKPARLTGDLHVDLAQGYKAAVVAYDQAMDLALLKIQKAPAGLTVLSLGNPEDLAPGDETVAIGHPEQGGLWTLTTGVLSAQIKDQNGVPGRDVWQMETSLNRGNSGGPLFDPRGYVVGVNTAIARRAADGLAITGINFAIKSSSARSWLAAHGLALNYGPLPLENAADATAKSPMAAGSGEAMANAASGTPAATTEPTPRASITTVSVAVTPESDTDATPAAAPTPTPGRPPLHFDQDLEQEQRPYTLDQVGDFLRGLLKKRDRAVDELDGAASGQ